MQPIIATFSLGNFHRQGGLAELVVFLERKFLRDFHGVNHACRNIADGRVGRAQPDDPISNLGSAADSRFADHERADSPEWVWS
jgi:hypothetical protein